MLSSADIKGNGVVVRSPQQEPPLPSLPRMAANLASSMAVVGMGVLMGDQVERTKAEIDQIASICKACPDWYRPSDNRCAHSKCGCHLERKQRLAALHCPIALW